jgi:hypothetical protein
MITHAPNGLFYAFEPIPDLFEYLRRKYGGQGSVSIHEIALRGSLETWVIWTDFLI